MEGVVWRIHVDDILVFVKDQQEHDGCLYIVTKRLQEAGLTLNRTSVSCTKAR